MTTPSPVHTYGRDVVISIDDGTGNFLNIGGQTSLSKKVSTDKIDFSSKDDGRIKASGYGQQEITLSVAGKLKLPDAGFARLQTVSNSQPPEVAVKVTRAGVAVYQGAVGVGNLSWDAATNGPVNYTVDLTAVAVPTVDDLTATS